MISRKLCSFVMLCLCVIAASSCSTLSVSDLPQPGNSYADGYDIVLEFENILNLPDRAKVVMNGTTIGVVDSVALRKSAVDLTARLGRDVRVPADSRAILQQATVLGDIYVAIERPAEANGITGILSPGGRLELSRTTSPPPLEDTIANLAYFVNSGVVQRIQDSIININRVTPERIEQVSAIASRVSRNLKDLSDNVDTVDLLLEGVRGTVGALAVAAPKLSYWVSREGMTHWDRMATTASTLGALVPSVGSIYTGGYWLVPAVESLGIALGAVQKSKWAVEGEYRPWRELFTDVLLPADKYPAMNITSVQDSAGREIAGNAEQVLRMLGAIP